MNKEGFKIKLEKGYLANKGVIGADGIGNTGKREWS